jgi:hypothetical protein
LPEREAAERAALAAIPRLAAARPDLSIESEPQLREPVLAAPAITARMAEHGFFEAPRVVAVGDLARLNRAVDAVAGDGWPPVFAWVYDELSMPAALGRRRRDPHCAARARLPSDPAHLDAHRRARRWCVGVAAALRRQGARRVSLWIALTDATTSHGCLHLVPRRRVPAAFARDWTVCPEVAIADAVEALHAVRWLPVAAGSILGWSFDVLHWGGTCTSVETPRRALSLEFIASDEPPRSDELPLVDVTGPLPSLPQRLSMIATAVCAYEKFERGLARYRPVA